MEGASLSSDCPQKFVNPQFPVSAGEKKSRTLHTFPHLHPRELLSQPGHRTVMYCAERRMYRGIDALPEVYGSLSSLRLAQHGGQGGRSEEHTSELQSQSNLVCRLLL